MSSENESYTVTSLAASRYENGLYGSVFSRSCLIDTLGSETPRMKPTIKAGSRPVLEATKAYMRQHIVPSSSGLSGPRAESVSGKSNAFEVEEPTVECALGQYSMPRWAR